VSEVPRKARSSSAETSSRGFAPLRSTAHSADCSYQSSSDRRTSVRRRKATTCPSSLRVRLMASSAWKRVWVSRVASSQTSRSPSLTYTTTADAPGPRSGEAVETGVEVEAAGRVAAGERVGPTSAQAERSKAARRRNPRDRNGRFLVRGFIVCKTFVPRCGVVLGFSRGCSVARQTRPDRGASRREGRDDHVFDAGVEAQGILLWDLDRDVRPRPEGRPVRSEQRP